ncbi:hypothetical protein MSAN_01102500 [Mycena sanguinolenta]|uniref:Uncharacterized protein n=1 Tax=Mycena sanguinolenta TaxID=230812 RepID=A0A8H6YU81_9AGAR|nr:hypothetical protein MSAN_01102500 [Mycena sanguinolenta]
MLLPARAARSLLPGPLPVLFPSILPSCHSAPRPSSSTTHPTRCALAEDLAATGLLRALVPFDFAHCFIALPCIALPARPLFLSVLWLELNDAGIWSDLDLGPVLPRSTFLTEN